MDLHEILRRYDEGVRFRCGCEERGLHPAVRAALLAGRVKPDGLLRCPQHRAPFEDYQDARVAAGA